MKFIRIELDPIDNDNIQIKGRIELFNNSNIYYCPKCPDKETVLYISSACKERPISIKTICCQEFRDQLIKNGLISK